MARMSDDDVRRLIQSVPRTEASPGFTEAVLEKLDFSRARRIRRRALAGLGAAVAIVASVSLFIGRYEQSKASARVELLRREYRELASELDKLRRLAAELEPVLDLGGTEQVDFVLDLRELGDEPSAPETEPVSHTTRP